MLPLLLIIPGAAIAAAIGAVAAAIRKKQKQRARRKRQREPQQQQHQRRQQQPDRRGAQSAARERSFPQSPKFADADASDEKRKAKGGTACVANGAVGCMPKLRTMLDSYAEDRAVVVLGPDEKRLSPTAGARILQRARVRKMYLAATASRFAGGQVQRVVGDLLPDPVGKHAIVFVQAVEEGGDSHEAQLWWARLELMTYQHVLAVREQVDWERMLMDGDDQFQMELLYGLTLEENDAPTLSTLVQAGRPLRFLNGAVTCWTYAKRLWSEAAGRPVPDFVIEHAKQSSLGAARRVCMQSLCEPESRLCVGATYAEGQTVEVHDGQQWVRGRVMKVHANDIVDVTLDHSPDSWAGYEMGFVRPLETLSSPALDEVQGAAAELALRHGAKQEETLRALASPPRRQRRAERALQQDVGPRWIVAIAEAVEREAAHGTNGARTDVLRDLQRRLQQALPASASSKEARAAAQLDRALAALLVQRAA